MTQRSGVIARKEGMTRIFTEDGRQVPVTVLKIDNCQVTGVMTDEKNGYSAVQLGAGTAKVKRTSKAMRGVFANAKVEPKKKVAEFRVDADQLAEVGAEVCASHFVVGQKVDACATSKGKGFQGGIKRHNFGGMRATHGVSISHRAHGSTGQCQDPGRVFKGKKMAGHMGARRITTQNLEIVSTDVEEGLLLVQGAVPGSKNGWVFVSDAVKIKRPDEAPFPAGLIVAGSDAPVEKIVETAADATPSNDVSDVVADSKEEGKSDEG